MRKNSGLTSALGNSSSCWLSRIWSTGIFRLWRHAAREPYVLLTPVQQAAAESLVHGVASCDVLVLQGDAGSGKTTVLQRLRTAAGGELIGARQFLNALRAHPPMALEEAFYDLVNGALAKHDFVMLDDLHLIASIVESCDYPRANLLTLVLTAILDQAGSTHKKLLFAITGDVPSLLQRRAHLYQIQRLAAKDYAVVCRAYLSPELAGRVDYVKIHRFAPRLSAHQLRNASIALRTEDALNTERFIEYLESRNLTSNVEIQEVEPVRWTDLKGLDDVIHSLEAKIALPFENDSLAAEFQLTPKRGVLLVGPPGTGKTTIGRALAHRLKGKFFLIDGTIIADAGNFYDDVRQVFDAAKQNAPSIIFIDDADVLFEDQGRRGFYRYLLTMLDGLEGASTGKVCVMMTAMEAGSLPPAVVRSGRIELWLETRLPDEKSRALILSEKLSKLPLPIGEADVAMLARASRGLTGADLKAAVEDGKLLFAYDKAAGKTLRPSEVYSLDAIDRIRCNRRTYARRRTPQFAEMQFGFHME